MPLSTTAQMFVDIARERDRAELQHPCVRYAGPNGMELRAPNTAALRAVEMEKLTDEKYAVRLRVSHL